jgi:hypothetical protein
MTFSLDEAHTFKNTLVTLRLSQHKNEICRHLYAVVPCIERRQVLASNFRVIRSSPVVFKPIAIICGTRAITAKIGASTCDGVKPLQVVEKAHFPPGTCFLPKYALRMTLAEITSIPPDTAPVGSDPAKHN